MKYFLRQSTVNRISVQNYRINISTFFSNIYIKSSFRDKYSNCVVDLTTISFLYEPDLSLLDEVLDGRILDEVLAPGVHVDLLKRYNMLKDGIIITT